MRIAGLSTLLVLFTWGTSVVAQGIATDRPGFIASAIAVPAGTFQVEAGATLESSGDEDGNSDHLTVGEALIRYGLLQRLELRAELPNYNSITFSDELDLPSIDGFGDSRLGVKYQIGPVDENGSFDLAAVGMISIPTGSDEFTSDEVEPEVILAANKTLGEGLGVGAQIAAALPATVDGRALEWSLTLGSSTVLGSVGVFIELNVDIPDEGSNPVMVHTGFVFPIGSQFQLDVHGALGASDAAADSFIGAGFAAAI